MKNEISVRSLFKVIRVRNFYFEVVFDQLLHSKGFISEGPRLGASKAGFKISKVE